MMTDHINDRALYAPLREHRDLTWPLLPGEKPSTVHHVNTDGMSVGDCCTEIGAEPIVRWNEAPDYPHGTNPGLGLLVLAVSAVLSIAAFVHLAGWLGWLS